MAGALEGMRVIECALAHAGPQGAALLGDLGADVIKIEPPEVGDNFRRITEFRGASVIKPDGRSYMFDALNRNKRSITIDLDKEKGREIAYHLVRGADVFFTNILRDTLSRLGMDYESLRKLNPRLIYSHISSFGAKGPDASQPGNDPVAQARSGMCLAQKEADAVPFGLQGLADQQGAIVGVYSVLAALVARERTGVGQEVKTSIVGSTFWLENTALTMVMASGYEFRLPKREKAPNPLHNYYRTGDGKWLWLGRWSDPDRYWPGWCRALEIEDLEADPRFSNIEVRTKNSEQLISILDEVFKKRSAAEWIERFANERLLASVVNTLTDALNDPQIVENNYVVECNHPGLSPMKYVMTPIEFERTPVEVRRPAPQLGEHTEEILLEENYSWEGISALKDEKVI